MPFVCPDFISPLIARFHAIASTIGEIEVVTQDTNGGFEEFFSLNRGSAFVVRDSIRSFISRLSAGTGNFCC
jgi:hypothetical protein